ncbi:hypothetical protein HPB47_018228 [Ixodes persulcatus]|uniref:Uncharacterized protein n=1 Tax=Ixodes persulcatus TaxID=34615 RepID=A0AC60QM36_IXOPE|nr:hypothetical protein HPB47_018228 [Ixodes persulcatus]
MACRRVRNLSGQVAQIVDLSSSGSKSLREAVKEMMAYIMSDEAASQFSMKGRKRKEKLSTLNLRLQIYPDGLVEENGEIRLLEIKCPSRRETKPVVDENMNVDYLQYEGKKLKLQESHVYYTQVQVSMYIVGANVCDFYVYSPKGPKTPVYEKRRPKWCIASPGGPRRVQTYPGLGSTTRMPFSPDTGKPRTARRGRANPHGSGSVETPLSKHLLSQAPPAGSCSEAAKPLLS